MKNTTIIMLFVFFTMISCNTKVEHKKDASINAKPNKVVSKTITSTKTIKNSQWIAKLKIKDIEEIDFDGDGIKDYICKSIPNDEGQQKEYWINSNFKIIKNKVLYNDGRLYRQFINLDEDKEPEVFEVEVFEDGADYVILDQDLKNGNDKIILYYNPVIIENNNYYWGYPWDVTSIMTKKENGKVKLLCSLDHQIIRDGNEEIAPKDQKQLPVIFFHGKHTQESNVDKISNIKWLTLKEIVKRIRK